MPISLHARLLGSTLAITLLALAPVLPAWAQGTSPVRECGVYPPPTFPNLPVIPAAGGTATVSTPFGDADLPTAPGAALGMYTTDVDILVWLGYPLADRQPIRGDSGYATFPCFFPPAPLAGITTFGNFPEYSYEQILLAEPDFILNGLGYDKTVNERLPQIAPTYSVNAFDGQSWQEHFKQTATALGRANRYDAWLSIYENRLAEVRERIQDKADMVVAPIAYWGGKFNSSCYSGVECTVFRDLGLTIFSGALDNDGKGIEVGSEGLGAFRDIDYAFMTIGVGEHALAEHQAQFADFAKNPLWGELTFNRNDQTILYEMEMVYGSPSGQLAFLEVVANALGE